LFEEVDPAVSGGEGALMSPRLEIESRLLIDIGLVAWVEGGREGDFEGDLGEGETSIFIERLRSENELRPSLISLMKSLMTVTDDRLSLLLAFGVLEEDSLDSRLS